MTGFDRHPVARADPELFAGAGLFAGVTINGSTIRQDVDANERFYGKRLTTNNRVERTGGAPEPVGAWRARWSTK